MQPSPSLLLPPLSSPFSCVKSKKTACLGLSEETCHAGITKRATHLVAALGGEFKNLSSALLEGCSPSRLRLVPALFLLEAAAGNPTTTLLMMRQRLRWQLISTLSVSIGTCLPQIKQTHNSDADATTTSGFFCRGDGDLRSLEFAIAALTSALAAPARPREKEPPRW